MRSRQNGNVFVYILIAVALFGGLMFALSKSASQEDAVGELAEGQVKIAVNEILAYAASAGNTVTQMQAAGATASQLGLEIPSDADFNTAPTIYKIFHPDGGGLNYKSLPSVARNDDGAGLPAGYYIGRFHVAWTPTAATDIVFVAYELTESVCEAINYKIKGDVTMPVMSGASLDAIVSDAIDTGTNGSVYAMSCASCEPSPECVTDGAGKYMFYSILDAE